MDSYHIPSMIIDHTISYEYSEGALEIKSEVLSVVAAGMSYFIQALHQTCVNGAIIFKNVQTVKCKYYSF